VLGSALEVEAAKKSLVKVVDAAPPQPPVPEAVARARTEQLGDINRFASRKAGSSD
jgi:hypothetical protein